jgi:two-component system sensor histidine kinase HydH
VGGPAQRPTGRAPSEDLDAIVPPRRADFAQRLALIGREVDGLQELLTEFLNFANPPTMELLPTDLNQLLEDVVQFVQPQCREHSIQIVKDFQKGLYPIPLDQHQFGRGVILNLLTNAIEQIGMHGTITLHTRESPDGIDVSVEDNGGGVPAELEGRVFEIFFSTKDHGTGLGLAIARRICQEHGGDLLLENHPKRGATFIARLPKSKILELKEKR